MPIAAQCGGKKNVLAMYSNRGIEAFSIWAGKQFLFTGTGIDELESILSMIQDGSNALYTLKVYKNVTTGDDVDEKTPASGSFNFYVKEKSATAGNGEQQEGRRTIGAIHRMIEEQVADRIASALEFENMPQEKESIEDILRDPERVKEWVGVLGMVKSLFSSANANAMPMQLANIGNATRTTDEVQKEYSPDEQLRLIAAVNTLQENDPNILSHLEKLAKISATNKPMFTNLISMLDAMP